MKAMLTLVLAGICFITYAIKPERQYARTPDKLGLAYSEYQLLTPDNLAINVWEYQLHDSAQTSKTVIFVGTDAGNMGNSILQAWAFMQKGIRVISFDYRGFGKSGDFDINSNLLFHPEFAMDLDTVIKAARSKFPSDKIGLYALSMGSYISLLKKEKTDFLIAEGFYSSPKAVVDRIKLTKDRLVQLPPKTRTIKHVRPRMPVLIFCASEDKVTTTSEARNLEKQNRVSIVEFTGAHLGGFLNFTKEKAGDEYLDHISSFLRREGI